MDFDDYQEATKKTAIYKEKIEELVDKLSKEELVNLLSFCYLTLGWVSECAELGNKTKKIIRDKGGILSKDDLVEFGKELGDSQWYGSELASFMGLKMNSILQDNIDKLNSRKERGVISGDGDNR